ncbi:glycosyl transferase [Pseudochryseolinea flava]|uniref:Glycosyl transferase n=2 Tax=Pseudochryseolinea flava TaxID=2059302 RepID=A0A364YCN0_9BACT|nr:glycosyl transferase [Pseudochryseolinea flava]
MGDVALLVPVVKSLTAAYPNVEVTVVTRPKFGPLFFDLERVNVFPADVDYTYTGILGLRDLFGKLLRKGPYDVVLDMHDHVRTIMLRSLFKIFGSRVVTFEKGRSEKKAFTRKENKITAPLTHTVERYRQAFEKAGYNFDITSPPYLALSESIQNASGWFGYKKSAENRKWIGVAPFAAHKTKIWPLENYPQLITEVIKGGPVKFFLFGGGDKEIKFFESLRQQFPEHCEVIAGQLKLRQEIALMQHLDLMICVDSSNMHMAALSNVPLLSIWGGTHPDVGFGPFGSSQQNVLQIPREELPCRPCSVYGKETCYIGDFPCLNRITPQIVSQKVLSLIAG